jgi:hypothetical protein
MAEHNTASRFIDRHRSSPVYDDKAEKLEYLRQMLIELGKLSTNMDCAMLAYLIEMAAMEAAQCGAMHAQSNRKELLTA